MKLPKVGLVECVAIAVILLIGIVVALELQGRSVSSPPKAPPPREPSLATSVSVPARVETVKLEPESPPPSPPGAVPSVAEAPAPAIPAVAAPSATTTTLPIGFAAQEMAPKPALPAAAPVTTVAAAPPPTKPIPPANARASLRDDKISIQTAALRICEQVGMDYQWQLSYERTQPLCQRYVRVSIINLPLEQALDEVVKKNGLKYRVEGKKVWLER